MFHNSNNQLAVCSCEYCEEYSDRGHDHSFIFSGSINSHTATCSTCGYVWVGHSGNYYCESSDHHYYECNCGYYYGLDGHDYEGDSDFHWCYYCTLFEGHELDYIDRGGYHWFYCITCGYETTGDHFYGDEAVRGDQYGHYYECECGHESDPEAHDFIPIRLNPYDYEGDVSLYYIPAYECTICGYIQYEL